MSTQEPIFDGSAASDDSDAVEEVEATGRRSRRPRRRIRRAVRVAPDPRGPLAVLIGIGVLAGVIAVGSAIPRQSSAAPPPPIVEPVAATTLVCPEPGGTDGAVVTSAFTSVPGFLGQDADGATTIEYLDRPDDAVDISPAGGITTPGAAASVVGSDGRERPLVVRAEGGLAPGLVGGSYDLALGGPKRGLAMMDCPAPAPSWWFVGGGSTVGRNSTLFLVNPEATDAEVEIGIAGPQGAVNAPSLRGLVVPAFSRTAVRLTRVAPRLPAAVWNVQVRTGRIVASLLDIDSEGFIQQGIDWVPPAAEPSTKVYIPGVLGTEGNRQLLIYPSGDLDAEVTVRILTAEGAFRPTDLDIIDAPAGAVTSINLAPILQGVSATVELISTEPIVAGMRQQHPGIDAQGPETRIEVSYAAGANRITTAAAAAGLPAVRGTEAIVWLTAPRSGDTDDTATTATISVLPFESDASVPEPIEVTLPFDRAIPVTLPRPQGATWMTVQITPASPVFVSQTSLRRGSRGSLISGYPLTALRTSVTIPSARQALTLSLP